MVIDWVVVARRRSLQVAVAQHELQNLLAQHAQRAVAITPVGPLGACIVRYPGDFGLSIEGSGNFVTSTATPIATG